MNHAVSDRQNEKQATGIAGLLLRVYGFRRRFATCAAAGLAFAMGYHVIFGQNGLTAYQHKREEARLLEQHFSRLKSENYSLQGHVDRLASDPGAIEHQAREELHYTRPGEVIVTLPAEKALKRVP